MKKFFCFILMLITFVVQSKEAPQLLDITVVGSMEAPLFEPPQLTFTTQQEYVLLITNPKPFGIIFNCGKFGQEINTLLLQGTSNVSQESITLAPHSKITWHFIPQKAGQHKFYASIPGLNQNGKTGEIVVLNPVIEKPSTSSQAVRQTEEEVAAKPKKKGLFSFFKQKKPPSQV